MVPSANGHARQQPSNPSNQAIKQPSNQATKQVIKKVAKINQQRTQILQKINQNGVQNPPSWVQNPPSCNSKSFKIGGLGRLGRVWGPSWAILDPGWLQELKKTSKS